MRKLAILPVLALVLALSPLGSVDAQAPRGLFVAFVKGAEEVPPVPTAAFGHATFELSADGTVLTFRVFVSHIDNVIASHIHLGPRRVNAPVVAFLFPGPSTDFPFGGSLAQGTITQADLIGPLAGHPFSDLISAMRQGGTYINVHTTAFPGGEIRGQIAPVF